VLQRSQVASSGRVCFFEEVLLEVGGCSVIISDVHGHPIFCRACCDADAVLLLQRCLNPTPTHRALVFDAAQSKDAKRVVPSAALQFLPSIPLPPPLPPLLPPAIQSSISSSNANHPLRIN
jgi:hypothetical protein